MTAPCGGATASAHRRTAIAAATLALACAAAAGLHAEPAHPPLALHPDNPHYFLFRGKPAVLITSGEHYGAVLNLDFDFIPYLDELHAKGLNHTRTFSGTYREVPSSFGITGNTLAPLPGRFICPWARSDTPGYAAGGNKFDLERWDPRYFRRLRRFVREAGKRGIVVELDLFCPLYRDNLWTVSPMNAANNVNGVGSCPRTEVLTLRHPDLLKVQLAVTRKIVRELNELDNLYFEICNEPYFGGVTMAWQRRIAREIAATEKGLPNRHLISMNVANGRKKVVDPPPEVSIFNFHYCVPPDTVALNYGLDRVIGENETGFRGRHDILYRTEGWDFILAGGAIYSSLDYSFTAKTPDGSLRDYRSPGGGSPELRAQLGILERFVESFDFIRMRPDAGVIRSVSGDLQARALSEPGRAYAIYVHVPVPKNLKDPSKHRRAGIEASLRLRLPAGTYRVEWMNTKSGAVERSETVEHGGGDRTLASPRFDDDVALRVASAEPRASAAPESPASASRPEWPQFRGPGGQGVSTATGLPVRWSDSENLVWKTALPGAGASSPIVAGDRIYLTGYSGYATFPERKGRMEDLTLHVVSIDRRSGDIVWDRTIAPRLPESKRVRDHGYAAPTPATDGKHLYVFFGQSGLFKLDLDGKEIWRADVGSGTHGWGCGTSPVLHENLVIVNASVESGSLVAIDTRSGKEVWRAGGMKASWNTPHLVALPGGGTELVVSVRKLILGFDPATGEKLWSCDGIQDYVCPSIVSHEGIAYALGGRSSRAIAVRCGGRGDVTATHRLWEAKAGANVCSPVIHAGHLYWVSDRNQVKYCVRLSDGEVVTKERVRGQPYASALLADGKIYVVTRRGRTLVFRAEPGLPELARNELSDRSTFNASPIAAGGRLYLRSDRFLYCIGETSTGRAGARSEESGRRAARAREF